MTSRTTEGDSRPPSIGVDAVELGRYSGIDTGNGELIVYDEKVEDAWIQSDEWVPVQGVR